MANVGLSVLEGVSNGTTPFVEASKDNIGALMERERGIPDKVVMITSLQEDRIRYGGIQSNHYGAYFTRHLYNNVLGYGAVVKACRIYAGVSADDTAHGHLLSGTPRQGSASSLVDTTTQAADVGKPQIDHFIPDNVQIHDKFTIEIGSDSIMFEATAATQNNVILGLKAAIEAEMANNPSGMFAQYLSPTLTYDLGSHYLETTGLDDNVEIPFVVTTEDGSDVIMDLYAGQEGQKDPGSWANTDGTSGLTVKAYPKDHPNGVPGKYLFEVYYNGVLRESYQEETWDTIIEQVNLLSMYIMAVPQETDLEITGDDPADIQTATFSGGVYTEFSTVADRATAFKPAYTNGVPSGAALFDGEDIQILVQTEIVTNTANEGTDVASSIRDYCGARGDCMHPFVLPLNANDAMVAEYSTALQENLPSFAAGYTCWTKTSNEAGTYVWTPALGHIIGAGYIRVPKMNRDYIWTPPAGVDSAFKDCIDITPNPLSQDKINLYVKGRSCNVVQYKKGYGFIIMSSRTYSSNALYHSIHIRRMTSWMVQTINNNMLWSTQKPNTLALRGEMVTSLTIYMKGIYGNGGLENSVDFSDACHVICDKTNNPPTQDRKMLNCDVDWIPTECTESVVIRLNRNDGVLQAKYLES